MTQPYYNPQQPQPGYAPQGYPPPAQPQYQQPGYPPQPQYAPQAPQGYPPAPQGPPAPPLARGTLSDFYGQPTAGGGPGLKFSVIGTTFSGVIARDVTDADVRQQTDFLTKQPAFYRDGRPKLAMIVPIRLSTGPSPEFPEGVADWWVKGADRDELMRAMVAAGVQPEDGIYFPKGGDQLSITYTHDKPGRAGMNPTKMKAVQYAVAGQAAVAPQAVAQQAFAAVLQPQYQPPAPQQFAPTQYVDAQGQPVQLPQAPQAQQAPQVQYQPPAPQQPVQAQAAPSVPPGLSPAQAAMVAQMTNAQQGPPQG
jgi:hypothetical protein